MYLGMQFLTCGEKTIMAGPGPQDEVCICIIHTVFTAVEGS